MSVGRDRQDLDASGIASTKQKCGPKMTGVLVVSAGRCLIRWVVFIYQRLEFLKTYKFSRCRFEASEYVSMIRLI